MFELGGKTALVTGCRRGGDEYLAVMDNSNKLVRLSVQFDGTGAVSSATVLGGISLGETHDFEGIAIAPGASVAYLSEEDTPGVRALIAHEITRARGLFAAARPAIAAAPPSVRPGVRLAVALYDRMLRTDRPTGVRIWHLPGAALEALR